MRAYLRELAYILNLVLCFFICVLLEEATASSFCDRVHPGRPLACSWGCFIIFCWSDCFSMHRACPALGVEVPEVCKVDQAPVMILHLVIALVAVFSSSCHLARIPLVAPDRALGTVQSLLTAAHNWSTRRKADLFVISWLWHGNAKLCEVSPCVFQWSRVGTCILKCIL